MSSLKNRTIGEKIKDYRRTLELKEGNNILAVLNFINAPTQNCQLSTLIGTDSIYKMNDENIILIFQYTRTYIGKKLINFTISNRKSYEKFLKVAEKNKDKFIIRTDKEFTNIKNKKSNSILIQWL